MEKVAIFVWVSNHVNAEDARKKQEQRIKAFCASKAYNVVESVSVVGEKTEGFRVLMRMLQSTNAKGIEKIVMISTNRVAGTVEDMEQVIQAFQNSGVALETLDGTRATEANDVNLISVTLTMTEEDDDQEMLEEDELAFGYDRTPDGWTVNHSEVEVVKYIFARRVELEMDPPENFINEVVEEYAMYGEELSVEDAKKKIPSHKFTLLIEEEVKAKWPVEYDSMIKKQSHHRKLHDLRRKGRIAQSSFSAAEHEPIVSSNVWDAVQTEYSQNHINTDNH